ncbi:MAG: hypothetical protein AB1896_12465 [Thermodesulfobacteriota bacterium]
MNAPKPPPAAEEVLEKALALGADLAGLAAPSDLRSAPSYKCYPEAAWPGEVRAVLVLALAHPEDRPELDYWGLVPAAGRGGTEGDRILRAVADGLAEWLAREHGRAARPLPYHVERGGVFLKDAAVLAGLGVIGRNNLLLTPGFGPRVRLRAVFLDFDPGRTEPAAFNPCPGCPTPCLSACPREALAGGVYRRAKCGVQMGLDEAAAAGGPVRYCRACELACPVGRRPGR